MTTSDPTTIPTILDAMTRAKEVLISQAITPEQLINLLGAATKRKKGRKVQDLPEFTFPDSGVTVRVRRIGPWTLDQIAQSMRLLKKSPPVPMNQVPDQYDDLGNVKTYRFEPNDADPKYKQDLHEYEQWVQMAAGYRLLDAIISSCVVVDRDDLDKEEIEAHRRALLLTGPSDEDDVELAERHRKKIEAMPDEEVFVRCVCMQTNEDMTALQQFVTSHSMPTPAQIEQQVDSFRPEVQGYPTVQNPDAVERVYVQSELPVGNGPALVR